ncbi:MAG: FAD-dependent oxidoreductase [Rhodospirillaceae bacterium]|nr:FAD-dependent oxidoreductase [Rhodospirillaceae bacterium]
MTTMTAQTPWDVIIMGAGTTGLMAAIFAAKRGGRVLLIDASPEVGGTLLVAHGQVSAAGTKLQAQKGITDTPQQHYDEALRISKGTIDKDLAHLAIFNAAGMFDWLMEQGFDVRPDCPVMSEAHEPYLVPRYYWGKEMGKSVVKVLAKALQEGIDRDAIALKTNTRITDLVQESDGSVTGVKAVDGNGASHAFKGKNVLLAAGGYAANPTYFKELCGIPLFAKAAYSFNQGAGLQLGVSAGGYARGRENYLCNFGWILQDDKFPSPITGRANTYPANRPPWEIYVNANAARFIREDEPSVDVREHTLLEQPDLRYWIVFDQTAFDKTTPIVFNWTKADMEKAFETHAMFTKADTLDALAQKIGLDAAALQKTVADYNAGVASSQDKFGRKHLPARLETGPVYAIRNQGASVTSTVGLAVDEQLRVIRPDRTPIPNLYAAGEILGGGQLQGNAFVGGMMAMPSLVFGKLLGERILPF